jgi:hypothetical protein
MFVIEVITNSIILRCEIYFQVNTKYHFQVTLYHILKLFQSGPDAMQGRKVLVSEFYEEIVFQDPTVLMQHLLTTTRQLSHGTWKHETDCK